MWIDLLLAAAALLPVLAGSRSRPAPDLVFSTATPEAPAPLNLSSQTVL